jgi:hypothetical protein
LNEAADKDVVVAFLGRPHRIDDRGSHVLKSLREIGLEQYYQAEITGFVLYLEGSTDLAILRAVARKIEHRAVTVLDDPFVHYIQNQPTAATHHFYGLREAKADLRAVAVFDRLSGGLPYGFAIPYKIWRKREIENYLCLREVLQRYAARMEPDNLVGRAFRATGRGAMDEVIRRVEDAFRVLGRDPWSADEKVSEEFLPRIFAIYFEILKLDNRLNKSNFCTLADFIEPNELDPEFFEVLDLIVAEAKKAVPKRG